MNSLAFVAVLIGSISSLLYVFQHRKQFLLLVQTYKVAFDRAYCNYIVRTILQPDFYYQNANKYALPDYTQHEYAVEFSRPALYDSIRGDYLKTIQSLGIKLLMWQSVPIILFSLAGYGIVYLSSIFIGLTLSLLFVYLTGNKSMKTRHAQYSVLLRHIYTINSQHFTTTYESSIHRTVNATDSLSISNHNYSQTASDKRGLRKVMSSFFDTPITWEKVWWFNDIALCSLLIFVFSITVAKEASELLSGALYIILVSQVFFVLTWLTIKITLRLLTKYQ